MSEEPIDRGLDASAPPDDVLEIARLRAALEHRLLGRVSAPIRVGRFTLHERIGAGGMGIVHAAYDAQLERRVAIKLLHPTPDEPSPIQRLVVEARAMAKLSHPHVATVYEIGDHEGRTFVAMEFLGGVTLRRWQESAPRRWPEVLEVYAQAGRGLAAAHAAELVHRDFKPDNAMIDDDGTVKVLDFGLARSLGSPTSRESGPPSGGTIEDEQASTRSAGLSGTPAYMSPEQFLGEPASAASDQFAFCVALWEALFGERPFAGKTMSELATVIAAGRVTTPTRVSRVPSWLRAAILRGLSADPSARWPAMTELLEALGRGRARARWRRGLTTLGAVAMGAVAVVGWQRIDRQRRIDACERAGETIDEVWNATSRATLHSALAAGGRPHAATTADKVLPWLDDHAHDWRAARTAACVATTVEKTWTADQLERSEWCLDVRRSELDALVTELSRADGAGLDMAVQAASGLPPIAACSDAELLVRLPSPPPDARAGIQALHADLSRALAMQRIGGYAEGVEVARALLERTETSAFPPFVAEVRLAYGVSLELSGDFPAAEEALERAYFDAAAAGALDIAAAAADRLAFLVGMRRARHGDGLRWAQHAELVLRSLPDASHLREATHVLHLAAVHTAAGEYDEAKTLAEHALALREAALGPDHLEVAGALNNLANVHEAMGTFAEAKSLHERALDLYERALGPEHPHVARSLNNLANVVSSMGDYDDAEALHERALAIQEAALGPDHPELSGSLNNLAGVHWAQGKLALAKPLVERALAIREKALGPEHPEVGAALHGLAMLQEDAGELVAAKALYERSLAIREKALGPEHPELARSLTNLAAVHQGLGDLVTAQAMHERVLAIRERALGPAHPDVGKALHNLASVRRARGAVEDAKALYERALPIQEKALGADHPETAASRKALTELARD